MRIAAKSVVLRILTLCCLALPLSVAWSATPAGTVIRNQATARYLDTDGRQVTVTSNLVETVIEQVAGLELNQDQSLLGLPGALIRLSHRIRNSGNGDDAYSLQVSNVAGDNFDLSSLAFYADQNQDGVPDSYTAISNTPVIAAGAEFYIIVAGVIPTGVAAGQGATLSITASSQISSTALAQNTDSILASSGAALRLTKSISAVAGHSPSGPLAVTLRYENIGSLAAIDVTLIDALPPGMMYVPGTAIWSEAVAGLTDANPTDAQSGISGSIAYCAYHTSCMGLPEAYNDSDNDSSNQVTAVISEVLPGLSGTVTFNVTINSQLSAIVLHNQAETEYVSNGAAVARSFSNSVGFKVLSSAAVVANGSLATSINGMNEPVSVSSAAQGGVVRFHDIIWNIGNSTDSFNIEVDPTNSSFPIGSTFRLLRSDGASLLVDTNNDGIVDTGPVLAGDYAEIFVTLQLAVGVSGNNSGLGYDLNIVATSIADFPVLDNVTNHLDEIIGNQVDITNQAPAGSAGALGIGPGPELNPVSTVGLNGNRQAVFALYIRHQGSEPDTYRLRTSLDVNGTALPTGWVVSFHDAETNLLLTNTGSMASGEYRHVVARVQVPFGVPAGVVSLFFGVVSDTSGAQDQKHDAVSIGASVKILLEPSLSAQLEPGGSIVYEHTVTNKGNTTITDLLFSLTQTRNDWTATIYADSDANGRLGPADQAVAGAWTLLPGETKDVFIKLYAPTTASVTDQNVSTLTAAWLASTQTQQVQDLSTVSRSHVQIRKEQAVDTGCDGAPDPGTDFSLNQIEVSPGNNCIVYRLTATNNGLEVSYNVTIHDYTPPYTLYRPSAQCSRVPCWLNEPASEQTGTINAETDQLLPGDSFFLQFLVRVQ